MKKTLLALSVVASFGLSSNAFASDIKCGISVSPSDCAGWKKLDDWSEKGANPDLINDLFDAYENGTIEEKELANKAVYDAIQVMSNEHKLAAFAVLNNITVYNDNPLTPEEEGYDSLLDQIINGGNMVGDNPEQEKALKDAYNAFEQAKVDGKITLPSENPFELIELPGQPADGDLQPIEDVIVEPAKPVTNEQKLALVTHLLSVSNIEASLEGTSFTFNHPEHGQMTIDLATISEENLAKVKDAMRDVATDGIAERRRQFEEGNLPPISDDLPPVEDVIVEPITPPTELETKIAWFNGAMDKAGKDAFIDFDPMTGKPTLYRPGETPLSLEGKESEVKKAMREKAKETSLAHKRNILADMEGHAQARILNRAFEEVGYKAKVTMNDEGHFDLTFIDPVSGNERTIDLTKEVAAGNLDLIKAQAKQRTIEDLPGLDPKDPEDGELPPIEDVIVDPISGEKIVTNRAEFMNEVNAIVSDLGGDSHRIDKYLTSSAEDKKVMAQALITYSESNEDLHRTLSQITFEVPVGSSGETETKSMLDYFNGVAEGDISPENGMTQNELALRKGLTPKFDEIDSKFLTGEAELRDAAYNAETQLKETITETQNAVMTNAQHIEGLNEAVSKTQVAVFEVQEVAKSNANSIAQGEMALRSAAQSAEEAMKAHFAGQKGAAEYQLGLAKTNLEHAAQSMETQMTAKFAEAEASMTTAIKDLQAQIDSLGAGTNPPVDGGVNPELEAGLKVAREKVELAFADVNAQLNGGKDNLDDAATAMTAELTDSKAELEAAAASTTDQMAAQFAAMQAQLDEQAKLIAELQAGENPTVPNSGISPEAEGALRQASATLQAKMDVAANKLQDARQGLEKAADGLRYADKGNGEVGINPPANTKPSHELGSVGQGQAVAYVQNGMEELYNAGNEYADQAAGKALADAKSYTDTQIAGINSRIDGIEEDLSSVMATAQAVTAARPYLSTNQTSAIGVGLGQAGDQAAFAVGYAHRINENWTANANVSGTSGNEIDYSVGAGVSYAW
ncbi:YadA C-terminal domain-containing protein [Vibrio campbellii]|uniref:YadA C-terminal domain-containing protein n=1 Tax=Vibrio campbellii TaxID=680 RepID=UPI00249C6C37|nr:YadA C-terminal domain-containing protein [Vibrio campbellii]